MKKVVGIYARVSRTKEKVDRSIDTQIGLGIKFANDNNFQYEIYNEGEGIKGTAMIYDRPELSRLLDDITAKKIHIMFAYDFSRIERNSGDKHIIYSTVEKNDAQLYTDTHGYIDFDNTTDRFVLDILSVAHGHEIAKMTRHIRKTLNKNAEDGRVHSAPPYGYSAGKNNEMIINHETAKTVQRIFKLRIEGNGGYTIAKILSAEQIPSPTTQYGKEIYYYRTPTLKSKLGIKKEGMKWNSTTINRIIKNRIYIGERKWKNQTFKSPSIIDLKTFEQAQEATKKTKNNSNNNAVRQYLLKGLIKCKCGCGSNFNGSASEKRNFKVYESYSRRRLNDKKKCFTPRIPAQVLEDIIWQRVIGSPLFLQVLNKEFNFNDIENESNTITKKIESLEQNIKGNNKSLEKALDLHVRGLIDEGQFITQATILKNEIIGYETEKGSLEFRLSTISDLDELSNEVKRFQNRLNEFENAEFETKRKLVQMFIDEIIVSYDKPNRMHNLEIRMKIVEQHHSNIQELSLNLKKKRVSNTSTTVCVNPPLLNCNL